LVFRVKATLAVRSPEDDWSPELLRRRTPPASGSRASCAYGITVVDPPGFKDVYEKSIADSGGIDAQVLGIGSDGHVGFNEPTSSLASRTRIKTLTQRTRSDNNAHFFKSDNDVPYHVITMGIGTIMEARTALLLAFGENKADAVAGAVEGPITASNPASILQMHLTAKLFLDEQSASKLARSDYWPPVSTGRATAWRVE
jgi:glucosamine-6-phosphate deaminase